MYFVRQVPLLYPAPIPATVCVVPFGSALMTVESADSEATRLISHEIIFELFDNSNLCDYRTSKLHTDGRTTCRGITALY